MTRRSQPIRPLQPALPEKLVVGDFLLAVEAYTERGRRLPGGGVRGASGTAWTSFQCGPWAILDLSGVMERPIMPFALKVVDKVEHPQTQISYVAARQLRSGIQLGEVLRLDVAMPVEDLAELIKGGLHLGDWLPGGKKKGQILVRFENVTIQPDPGDPSQGRIVEGEAVYPAEPRKPDVLRLALDGFTAEIHSLVLTPGGATADVTLILPHTLGASDNCGPAMLHLGSTAITSRCELYAERPDAAFGPWIVGETGMIISGTGYTADFSPAKSPIPRPTFWKGLKLHRGTADGTALLSRDSNTGYMAAHYTLWSTWVAAGGFEGEIRLIEALEFQPVNPFGTVVGIEGGWLRAAGSRIVGGQLGPGWVSPPAIGACDGSPGRPLKAKFLRVDVLTDMDVAGEVTFDAGTQMAWGELTHTGSETVAWMANARSGYLYLPAGPAPTLNPEMPAGFLDPGLVGGAAGNLAALKAKGISGVTITFLRDLLIFSPDRPNGTNNPILVPHIHGWMRIASQGVDGELEEIESASDQELGDITRTGYVGNKPFKSTLFHMNRMEMLLQYITSAVFDSQINGTLDIPEPCKIPRLEFADMELTSTANLAGGDIVLPSSGVKLDYWQLDLVPTGNPAQAGVASVRTGRLVFLAAGIAEPRHFSRPFALTWGEMLADGNLGELFLNLNTYGQRFDGIPYSPSTLALSKYVAGNTDGFLATCGTVHINFFGPHLVNIQDARHADSSPPFNNRIVTVPKNGGLSCPATDLHLAGTWRDSVGRNLAVFDFPDVTMDYHDKAQDGFLGSGGSELGFLHSNPINSTIEIHRDVIDVSLRSAETHDIDLSLLARLGAMSSIAGCVRIEGPTLQRISVYGMLEQSASPGDSILGPKAGYAVEINITVTPSTLDFYASGDMLFTVLATAVDVSAQVHLFQDFARGSAEGEISGQIDCNTAVAGLEGAGQVTWYADGSTAYLQGKLKMTICGWAGGGSLEGGLFLGLNVDRARAWVLAAGGDKFGISNAILPPVLSGVYGYGQVSFSVNWYIFGGGVQLFAGIGFFAGAHGGGIFGRCGIHVFGEILGGLVSASAWANLALMVGIPLYFEGSFGLEGCVVWVVCASVEVTAGLGSDGFYLV
jgi:hypothetical protein